MKKTLLPAILTPTHDEDALRSLLRRIVPYEKAGAVVPRDLLQFGMFGSIAVIATGLLTLILPGAESVRHGEFFLVLGGATASLDSLMKTLAIPAVCFGFLLLGVDVFLLRVRTSARWRSVVVVQAATGGLSGTFCTLFLALVLLNLVIWIALVALAVMALGLLLAAMAQG